MKDILKWLCLTTALVSAYGYFFATSEIEREIICNRVWLLVIGAQVFRGDE